MWLERAQRGLAGVLRAEFSFGMVAAFGASVCVSFSASASTTSVCQGYEQSTVDQPDVVNPVYSHLPATSKLAESGEAATAEQLLALFIDRHTAMDYTAATEAALRLTHVAPDRPHGYYNLACALARLRRVDEAIVALDQAIDNGWRDSRHMMLDPDLAALRSLASFASITSKLSGKIASERMPSAPLRSDDWSAVKADLDTHGPAVLTAHHVPLAVVAVIRDGRMAGVVGIGSIGEQVLAEGELAELRFRVHRPVELLGLIAGAQLQQRGQLMLAELMEQGASLDRELKSRANHNADRQREPYIIIPAASRDAESGQHGPPLRIDTDNPTFSLLTLSIEFASGSGFRDYCIENILEPLRLTKSSLANANAAPPDVPLARGQSWMGTPLSPEQFRKRSAGSSAMYATAGDLARLIELMLTAETVPGRASLDLPLRPDPIDILARVNALASGGVGLGVQIRNMEGGRRVQILEVGDGVGCLMRWHPRHQSGVVVLFNSESGAEAALRLAHIALGGP